MKTRRPARSTGTRTSRPRPPLTGPDSIKLLAYGKPRGRRAPETKRMLEWYRQMYLIRRFEEAAAEMYALGKVGGFLHLYIGEEAVAVGAMATLQPQDHLLTHYRDHGYALARGSDPGAVMAELFGRSTGVTRGMGGSMHLVDPERNFWGGHAIVGGHIVIAPGLALAAKMQGQKRVVVDVFGDGATAIGEFHEGVNFAAIWDLPVIFLVENNLYGMGARPEEQFKVPEIYQRARAYGIPGKRVDGMDVVEVNRVVGEAVTRARAGGGPTIIEAMTYRFRGHSMADAESYREKAEVRKWHKRDPIRVLDSTLIKGGHVHRRELHTIQRQVDLQIQDAVVFADNSPFPALDTLFQNIYASPLEERGGAVSGPEVVIPSLLTRKAERLTARAEERSRQQPALISLDSADAGGPGGRPTAEAPPDFGAAEAAPPAAAPAQADGSESAAVANEDGKAPAKKGAKAAAVRSRRLPQPGRPGSKAG
ncbi:MAG TPA: pyruvate dehydrogenase (acetyl-transferring) E1 component subunit alpha [Candidatus Dormibacteraeota bacterium]|nr:pyruvate dehydrogenase (acetyl-transferring) E1 component subunit alpha [Candidatus Dormibacteraeota bacterium]